MTQFSPDHGRGPLGFPPVGGAAGFGNLVTRGRIEVRHHQTTALP